MQLETQNNATGGSVGAEIKCTSKTWDKNKYQIGFYCWRNPR